MNGRANNHSSRYYHLLVAVACLCLTGTIQAAEGHRLAGSEECYPLTTELYQTIEDCKDTPNDGNTRSISSRLVKWEGNMYCQKREFYGTGCLGVIRYPNDGGWTTSSMNYCNNITEALANNVQSCELKTPDCELRIGHKIAIDLDNDHTYSEEGRICFDYCVYGIIQLFDKDPVTERYKSAYIAKDNLNMDNCYSLPPSFDPVIPEQNELPEQTEPTLPDEPLPPPTYNITEETTHINGQKIHEYPFSGCTLLSGGAFLCKKGDIPPIGRDGEKTHQKTGGLQNPDGTEYDYFSPLPSTGLTGTGQGVGGVVKDTTEGATYGGDDCNSPPVCTGNEIQCAQLRQTWLLRCSSADSLGPDGFNDLVTSAKNKLESALKVESVSIDNLIDWTPSPSQNWTCPAPLVFNTPAWGKFEWKFDPLCTLAGRVRGVFLLLVKLVAVLIFIRTAKG